MNEGNRGMYMKLLRIAGVLATPLVLSACISLGGKTPDKLIALTPEAVAPAGATTSGEPSQALVVLDPMVDRRLDVQRVPVRIDDSNIAYLKKATWVERPARQFRRLLAETLRARGGRLVLEGEREAAGKVTLSGQLLDFGYDARQQAVVLRFDAVREEDGQLRTKRFEAVVPSVSAKAEAVVPALNQAANDVARQVAEWVG